MAYYRHSRRCRRGERGRRGSSQFGHGGWCHAWQWRRRDGGAEDFLPPSSAIGGAVGVDAEGFEEGAEPAFVVLVHLLASEAEEEEEEVGKEKNGP